MHFGVRLIPKDLLLCSRSKFGLTPIGIKPHPHRLALSGGGERSGSQLEGLNIITEEGRELPERNFRYQALTKIDQALINYIDKQAGDSDKLEKQILALFKEPVSSKKGILTGTSLVELNQEFFHSIDKKNVPHLKATALNRLASLLHLMGEHKKASTLDKEADLLFDSEWMTYCKNRK